MKGRPPKLTTSQLVKLRQIQTFYGAKSPEVYVFYASVLDGRRKGNIARKSRDKSNNGKTEREKSSRREYEQSPKRKAQHEAWRVSEAGRKSERRRNKKWRESEHGREVCRQKSRRYYEAHKDDPEFIEHKREYNREYRKRKREAA